MGVLKNLFLLSCVVLPIVYVWLRHRHDGQLNVSLPCILLEKNCPDLEWSGYLHPKYETFKEAIKHHLRKGYDHVNLFA